jgi:hypothetical protein
MTLWTKEEAERWPIETKILVDEALGRGVEPVVISSPNSLKFEMVERYMNQGLLDGDDVQRVLANGAGLTELQSRSVVMQRFGDWPSDSVGLEELEERYSASWVEDLWVSKTDPLRHQRKNLLDARPKRGMDGRRRR